MGTSAIPSRDFSNRQLIVLTSVCAGVSLLVVFLVGMPNRPRFAAWNGQDWAQFTSSERIGWTIGVSTIIAIVCTVTIVVVLNLIILWRRHHASPSQESA